MELKLYYFETCPYCQIVLQVIDQLKLKVYLVDIHQGVDNRHYLFEKTGRYTVPCLFIDGSPMHESYDIINWLKNNQDRLDKNE